MNAPLGVLTAMREVQSILPRVTIADANLAEEHFNAIAAVAELIAACKARDEGLRRGDNIEYSGVGNRYRVALARAGAA